jgi:hypothetical protein
MHVQRLPQSVEKPQTLSGRPSLLNDDLVRKVNERVRDDRRFTVSGLSLHFPQISRAVLYDMANIASGHIL